MATSTPENRHYSQTPSSELRKQQKTLKALCGTLIGIVVVYAAAVGYFVLAQQKELSTAVMVAFPAMIASFVPIFARLNGIQKELRKRSGQE